MKKQIPKIGYFLVLVLSAFLLIQPNNVLAQFGSGNITSDAGTGGTVVGTGNSGQSRNVTVTIQDLKLSGGEVIPILS